MRPTPVSIELWDEIARRNGCTTEYVWHDTLPPLLDDVSASRLDVGIAGISITRGREARMDFSHPIFNAGPQVIAPQRADESWFSRLRGLASASLVENGRAEAMVFDAPVLHHHCK